jgi:hypothetical protein
METTIRHPIFGRIKYNHETSRVTVQHGDLAERISWLLRPKNVHLLGNGDFPDRFIRVCEVLGLMQNAKSVKTEGEEPPHVKTIIEHSIYGRITYDGETEVVTVQRADLAERITWLLKPENSYLLGHGYCPNYFIRPCWVLGVMQGATKTTDDGR